MDRIRMDTKELLNPESSSFQVFTKNDFNEKFSPTAYQSHCLTAKANATI